MVKKRYLLLIFLIGAPLMAQASELYDRAVSIAPYYNMMSVNIAQCADQIMSTWPFENAMLIILVCNGTQYYIFSGCLDGTYENARGQQAITPYRYPGDPSVQQVFGNFCAACPTLFNVTGSITSNYAQHKGAVTDCRIPANQSVTDSTGTFVFTSDCHYQQ